MKKTIQIIACCLFSVMVIHGKGQSLTDSIRLNHIAKYVSNLQKSIVFYEKVLQLKRIPDPFNDSIHAWYTIGSGTSLHLIEGAPKEIKRNKNDHLCFSVVSMENFIMRLNRFKISFSNWEGKPGTINKRVDGVQQIYFQDPDGHWIEINDAWGQP